jgi:Repeat of unknown function (DUF5648)
VKSIHSMRRPPIALLLVGLIMLWSTQSDAINFIEIENVSPISAVAYTPTPVTVGTFCSATRRHFHRVTVQASRINMRLITASGDDEGGCVGGFDTAVLPALPPGRYELFSYNYNGELKVDDYSSFLKFLEVAPAPPTIAITSMAYAAPFVLSIVVKEPEIRYFLTPTASDVSALLALNTRGYLYNPLWRLADAGFKAWPAAGPAPATAVPVCRFFAPSASTHFYSAKPEECALLRAMPSVWTDEGISFRILLPEDGVCGSGTQPVYRMFSARYKNHRYTTEADTYRAMRAEGWVGEGTAFCAPVS